MAREGPGPNLEEKRDLKDISNSVCDHTVPSSSCFYLSGGHLPLKTLIKYPCFCEGAPNTPAHTVISSLPRTLGCSSGWCGTLNSRSFHTGEIRHTPGPVLGRCCRSPGRRCASGCTPTLAGHCPSQRQSTLSTDSRGRATPLSLDADAIWHGVPDAVGPAAPVVLGCALLLVVLAELTPFMWCQSQRVGRSNRDRFSGAKG